MFVTTSKASVLKMLEIDMDFAKKVAVPAVANLRELGTVIQQSGVYDDDSEIGQTLGAIQQRTGSENVGIGIKTVLDCVFEAKAGGREGVRETFAELMVESIQEMNG